jgi:hypothetical protein
MNGEVRSTQLSRTEIAERMKKEGVDVSHNILKQPRKKDGYVKRKMRKKRTCGPAHKDRNAQFMKIADLRKRHQATENSMISMAAAVRVFR